MATEGAEGLNFLFRRIFCPSNFVTLGEK